MILFTSHVDLHRPRAGDLDGDLFFVTWDPHLIPPSQNLQTPADYAAAPPALAEGPVTADALIHYFAHHSNAVLGLLNGAYIAWANLRGTVKCAECAQLSALFARGADSVKTGERLRIPAHLELTEERLVASRERQKDHVWGRVLERAGEEVRRAQGGCVRAADLAPLSEEAVWKLIDGQDLFLSEWELFRMVEKWCKANGRPIVNMALHLDFGCFSRPQVRGLSRLLLIFFLF